MPCLKAHTITQTRGRQWNLELSYIPHSGNVPLELGLDVRKCTIGLSILKWLTRIPLGPPDAWLSIFHAAVPQTRQPGMRSTRRPAGWGVCIPIVRNGARMPPTLAWPLSFNFGLTSNSGSTSSSSTSGAMRNALSGLGLGAGFILGLVALVIG